MTTQWSSHLCFFYNDVSFKPSSAIAVRGEFQCLHAIVVRKILTSNHHLSNEKADIIRCGSDVVSAAFANSTPSVYLQIQRSTVTLVACPCSFATHASAKRYALGRRQRETFGCEGFQSANITMLTADGSGSCSVCSMREPAANGSLTVRDRNATRHLPKDDFQLFGSQNSDSSMGELLDIGKRCK